VYLCFTVYLSCPRPYVIYFILLWHDEAFYANSLKFSGRCLGLTYCDLSKDRRVKEEQKLAVIQMRQSHRFGALFKRRLFGAINNAVYNVHRMRSTIYVPLVKTPVLMSLTFAGIFPSCHLTSSFLLSSMPSAFSRVFCESRLMAFSFGHTMMLVSFHLHPYFLAFLGFLGNL